MKRIVGFSLVAVLLVTILATSFTTGFIFEKYDLLVLTIAGRALFVVHLVFIAALLGLIIYRYRARWRDAAGFSFIAVVLIALVSYGGWSVGGLYSVSNTGGFYDSLDSVGLFNNVEHLCIMTLGYDSVAGSDSYFCPEDNNERIDRDEVRSDGLVRSFHRWLKDF